MYLQSSVNYCSVQEGLDIKDYVSVFEERRNVQVPELPVGYGEYCGVELICRQFVSDINVILTPYGVRVDPWVVYCYVDIVEL